MLKWYPGSCATCQTKVVQAAADALGELEETKERLLYTEETLQSQEDEVCPCFTLGSWGIQLRTISVVSCNQILNSADQGFRLMAYSSPTSHYRYLQT